MRRSVRALLASLAAVLVVVGGVSAPASAAALAMNLSASYGPSGGGGTIIGSVTPSTAVPAPFPAGTTPVVQFQYVGTGTTGCGATAKAITQVAGTGTTTTAGVLEDDPATVRRITPWKIVFAVPSGPYPNDSNNLTGLVLVGTQTQAKWSICVYDTDSTTSSTLLATATYTLVLQPTITSISPTSSPAAGGMTVTVNGTGFTAVTTPITAAVGGAAMTNVKVAANGNSFTATTGPRASGTGLALTVNTPGGTVSSLDPDNNPSTSNPIPFSYTNGITITPNTGAVGSLVTIDVTGAGFSALHFDTTGLNPTSALAHTFLVQGAYDPATNRGVDECILDVVVSDNELVCDLDLSANQLSPTTSAVLPATPIVNGAYILTVVANGATNAGVAASPSIISSGAAFVVAPY